MNRKRLVQMRISHLLWITLVAAAFLGGLYYPDRAATVPAAPITVSLPAMGPKPISLDFSSAATKQASDTEVFSFYVGLNR